MKGRAGTGWTVRQVILWWELRRLFYNGLLLLVGAAGIAAMELVFQTSLPDGEDFVEPMALALGVVLYGFLANVFYTFGSLIELWTRRRDAVLARSQGEFLFKAGTLFSVALTSLPFFWACIAWVLRRFHV